MTGWPRCSFAAEAAGDRQAGTASPAHRWFLVEHPGPWGRNGYLQRGLDPDAVLALSAWATTNDGRVLLVRRTGRPDPAGPQRWFRVDSRPGHETVVTGTYTAERELVDAVDTPGEPRPGPLCLVCVHGRHDTCCAVRGRPVAAALAAADPDATWECSHVGGCRFAPAVVLLPHGYVLGGVSAAAAPALLAGYRGGELDPLVVRGRSSLPTAVQAARQVGRDHTGACGVDALAPVAVVAQGHTWHVRLTGPDVTVVLTERREPAGRPLTCAATPRRAAGVRAGRGRQLSLRVSAGSAPPA